MKKIFVLDSNIPMLDNNCHEKFEDNDIVIPSTVIKELNKNKTRRGEAGKFARDFTNFLDSLGGGIYEGVKLDTGGTLKVVPTYMSIAKEIESIFHELDNDEYILSVAIHLHREYERKKKELNKMIEEITDEEDKNIIERQLKNLKPVVLVTRDTNVRIKAKKFNVTAQTYERDNIDSESLYTGNEVIPVPPEVINKYVMDKLKLEGDGTYPYKVTHPILKRVIEKHKPLPNQYFILVDQSTWSGTKEEYKNLYATTEAPVIKYIEDAKGKGEFVGLVSFRKNLSKYNIFPRNLHQSIMVDMLVDPNTPQKSIVGTAGSGKTLFALLISVILTNDYDKFDEIIITRPTVEAEYQIGALPGNEAEKMDPFLRGFKGNLKFIVNQMNQERNSKKPNNNGEEDPYDFENFNIRTESMGYMRGETTFRQIIIMDEAQNSTSSAMKTALTRVGEESLIIILGDVSQIDYHLVDALSNGLSHAVELMKDDDLASHVTLEVGERSELSKRIAKKWDTYTTSK